MNERWKKRSERGEYETNPTSQGKWKVRVGTRQKNHRSWNRGHVPVLKNDTNPRSAFVASSTGSQRWQNYHETCVRKTALSRMEECQSSYIIVDGSSPSLMMALLFQLAFCRSRCKATSLPRFSFVLLQGGSLPSIRIVGPKFPFKLQPSTPSRTRTSSVAQIYNRGTSRVRARTRFWRKREECQNGEQMSQEVTNSPASVNLASRGRIDNYTKNSRWQRRRDANLHPARHQSPPLVGRP